LSESIQAVYDTIIVEIRDRVGLVTLNRPKALNALNYQMMKDVTSALNTLDGDIGIGCIVLTGSGKVFAAGADIKEMEFQSFTGMYEADWFGGWEVVARTRKPVIAAVSGYALGGGCELAMACDMIFAADNAKFGLPEITLGVIPGMGGSQRLTRAVGKSKAMELCLTGRMMDAVEAERSGLVARVIPVDQLLEHALNTADAIANMSLLTATMVKEAVNRSYEVTLTEGIRFERRMFHSAFAMEAHAEGMAAFREKRPPKFSHG
jgi:enoyl-CoA hydratase